MATQKQPKQPPAKGTAEKAPKDSGKMGAAAQNKAKYFPNHL